MLNANNHMVIPMTDHSVHFSSEKSNWRTPFWLFEFLDEIFGFDMDACANDENHLLDVYCSEEYSILTADITHRTAFMNPPYGDAEKPCGKNCKKQKCEKRGYHTDVYIPGIGDFIDAAHRLSKQNNRFVCLVPARTETKWFQTCWKADAIVFLRGRLTFQGAKSGAPFPSCLVVFGRGLSKVERYILSEIGKVVLL